MKVKEADASAIKASRAQASAEAQVQDLQGRLRDAASAQERLENTLLEVTDRLKDVNSKRGELETNLMIERQWRESLQKDLKLEQDRVADVRVGTRGVRGSTALLSLRYSFQLAASQLEPVKEELRSMHQKYDELTAKHKMLQVGAPPPNSKNDPHRTPPPPNPPPSSPSARTTSRSRRWRTWD